jgi:hypothetical protein
MEHDLHKNIGYADVCTEFEMLKVKVPIIFFGTVGFSPRKEGRYLFTRYFRIDEVSKVAAHVFASQLMKSFRWPHGLV